MIQEQFLGFHAGLKPRLQSGFKPSFTSACPADSGHLRPLREADAGQRGAAEGRLGVSGHRTTPRQPLWPMAVTWKNSAILGSGQRPHY